jgi:predicted DNA-binding transcriptional regulator YafY
VPPLDFRDLISAVREAIDNRRVVRLGYERSYDGVISLHFVAPIDMRGGDSRKTADNVYIWAYCFDEAKPETHLVDRVRSISATNRTFDPWQVFQAWPDDWPLPHDWVVPRIGWPAAPNDGKPRPDPDLSDKNY